MLCTICNLLSSKIQNVPCHNQIQLERVAKIVWPLYYDAVLVGHYDDMLYSVTSMPCYTPV